MSSSVEKIKERLSIVDVISAYLKLDKAGANYKAKCPFHNEKSPSFFVSPERNSYYCFGCGAKGDMFTFVEEFEGVEFKQALKNLADKAGVELVPEKRGENEERDRLFATMEAATEFYERELAKPENKFALDYLHKRGLTDETITKWRLGFAKNEWRSLHDYLLGLTNKKVSEQDMLVTGLIKKSDNPTHNFYDVFRGRIMFPICDQSGQPVGFSGRIIIDDDKAPKYLNSPATPLFNKSEVLFGFDRAKSAIRRMNYSVLVEGQMDLLMSHQAGLENTIASSGTALTDMHLRRLLRLSPRIMFAFDADSAGFNATKRSAELALQLGMEVKIVSLPQGEDPASLVLKNPNHWRQALKESKHIIEFYADSLLGRKVDRRLLSRELKASVLPFVLLVESSTEQAHYVKSIAEKTGLKEEAIWDDLKAIQKVQSGQASASASASQYGQSGPPKTELKINGLPVSRRQGIEKRIFGIIYWQQSKAPERAEKVRKKFTEIAGAEMVATLEKEFEPVRDKLIFEAEQYYDHSNRFETDLEEIFINLEEEILKDELGKQMSELHQAEKSKDNSKIQEFLALCQKITSRLAALRKKV